MKPKIILKELFAFLLDKESIEGLRIEGIIDKVVEEGEKIQVYKPRSGKINGSKHLYSKE